MAQPVAVSLPFAIDQSGAVGVQPSATAQLRDRVTALASTQPGQRVAAVGFGVATAHLLFTFRDPMAVTEIGHDVQQAMTVYEPTAVLKSITPVMDATGTGIAGVIADAARKDDALARPSAHTTVRVGVGGTVTDYASTTQP